jgi:hypothetical protein
MNTIFVNANINEIILNKSYKLQLYIEAMINDLTILWEPNIHFLKKIEI